MQDLVDFSILPPLPTRSHLDLPGSLLADQMHTEQSRLLRTEEKGNKTFRLLEILFCSRLARDAGVLVKCVDQQAGMLNYLLCRTHTRLSKFKVEIPLRCTYTRMSPAAQLTLDCA